MKGNRHRRGPRPLDWFAEDPWAEPESAMFDSAAVDWNLEPFDSDDEDLGDSSSDDDEGYDDDWGPIRLRRGS
jgi:hypothetical protein